jgi:hypothetical protein
VIVVVVVVVVVFCSHPNPSESSSHSLQVFFISFCFILQLFARFYHLICLSLSPQHHHHHHFAAAFDHFPFVGCFHLWSSSITERKRRRRRSSRTRSRAHLFTSKSSFFLCGTNSRSAKLEINLVLSLGGRRVWKRNSRSRSTTMMALQLVSSFCSCCINDGFSSVVTRVV